MMKEQKVVEVTPEDDPRAEDEGNEGRETWDNQCEFFLSCLGYAVGFGNVWRFPYLAYKNGGAIFLIPYIVMLLLAGLPLFFLELALGQFSSLGPNKVFLYMAPITLGVGWGMLVVSFLVAIYYNVILAWSLFYTFQSFTSVLPWGHCNNSFNSKNCFTMADARACQNESKYYYDHDCIDTASYCDLTNLTQYNLTHCIDPENSTAIQPANATLYLISASEDFFKHRMLRQTEDISWSNMGALNWDMVGCLALAWIIVGGCLYKGVKSSGKVVYFTAIFPYVVLVILFFRGVTLPGAYEGIEFYALKPNTTKLLEVEVWGDAATQIFYSLGSSFGGLITLASYNKYKNNCMRDAIVIAISNCSTSIFAGFVIFSFLGFMAQTQGTKVPDLVTSGSGLAFIVYAEAVTNMPLPPLWAILFFFMLITLGLDSQFTMVETLSTAVFNQWPSLRNRKAIVVTVMCVLLFFSGLTMVTQGGMFMFELFNFYSAGISVLILAICEVVTINYLYGFKRFIKHISEDMGIWIPTPLWYYWAAAWNFLTPASLLLILVISVVKFTPAKVGDYTFETSVQGLGWCITFSSIVCIPLLAAYVIWTGKYKGKELIQATPKFCPAHVRTKRARDAKRNTEPDGTFKYIYDNDGYQEGVAKVYPQIGLEESLPPYENGSAKNGGKPGENGNANGGFTSVHI